MSSPRVADKSSLPDLGLDGGSLGKSLDSQNSVLSPTPDDPTLDPGWHPGPEHPNRTAVVLPPNLASWRDEVPPDKTWIQKLTVGLEEQFRCTFGDRARLPVKLVEFACNLAREGHEGRNVGTTLVFSLEPLTYGVHLEGSCPFLQPINFMEHDESFITNFCLGDGAVIFDKDLNLVGCWQRLLSPKATVTQENVGGMRHKSAIALTEVCKTAVAICVSEGGGKVKVFHKGALWLGTDPLFTAPRQQDVKSYVLEAVQHTLQEMSPPRGKGTMLQSMSIPEDPSTPSTASSHHFPRGMIESDLFRFNFNHEIATEQFEKITALMIALCEQGLSTRQVQAWLGHPELRLDRGTLPAVAPQWFAKEDMMVGDMRYQTNVIQFEQAMRSDERFRNSAESIRLLNEGAKVAAELPPFIIDRHHIQARGEIVLHIKGDITPSLPPEEQKELQTKIVQDILKQFGEEVTFERFSSIVVNGSEKLLRSIQARLNQSQVVKVAGFTIDRVSWGKDLSFSLCSQNFLVHQVLEGLHEYVAAFQANSEKPKSVTNEHADLGTGSGISDAIDMNLAYQEHKANLNVDKGRSINKAHAVESQSVEDGEWEANDMKVKESMSYPFHTACLHTEQVRTSELYAVREGLSCLQRFPKQLRATIVRVPQAWTGKAISNLQQDGITGKNCTVVLIDRVNRVRGAPHKWEVLYSPHLRTMLKRCTPTRLRVVSPGLRGRRIHDPMKDCADEEDVLEGAVVDAEEFEAASRSEGAVLTFTYGRYDMFPQANTTLESGQLVCFGSPATCQVEIGPLTVAGAEWLQSNTDSTGVLTSPKNIDVDFVRKLPDRNVDPEVKLLAGFRQIHSVEATALGGGMLQMLPQASEGMFVTFEYNAQKAVSHIVQEKYGVPKVDIWHGNFDLDCFALRSEILSDEGQEPTMQGLAMRNETGCTIAGIARPQPQSKLDPGYDVHFFVKPRELLKEGDLFLVLREPSALPHGDSERMVRDQDVKHFAKAEVEHEMVTCVVCKMAVPTIKTEPCNHQVLCADCAESLDMSLGCPICRESIERFVVHGHKVANLAERG